MKLKHLVRAPIVAGLNLVGEPENPEWPRYIRTTDITGPDSLGPHAVSIAPEQVNGLEVAPNDLLFTRTGSLGTVYFHRSAESAAFAGYLVRVRPDDTIIDPRWLWYWAQSSACQEQIQMGAIRSTIDNFNATKIANLTVPDVDLETSGEMADFLDRECARIDDLQTKLAVQREQLRELANRTSSEVLGGSEMVPLKRLLLDSCVGIVVQPARLYQDSGPVPCLRPVNVKDGAVARDSLVWLSAEAHAANARSELREGDVIVVRSGQAGAAAVVPRWAAGGNCVDMLVLRPNPARCDPRYLCDFLNSELALELIREYSVGSILGHMNLSAIRGVPCPWRPLPDQRRVVSKVAAFRAALSRAQGEISNTARLLVEYRDALITEAVAGKLPVAA